jgi:beta-galactosidase
MNLETEWAEIGHEIAFAQFSLRGRTELPRASEPASQARSALKAVQEGNRLHIDGHGFQYEFLLDAGAFSKLAYQGINMISKPMSISIWRAPIDNDKPVIRRWKDQGYDRALTKIHHCEWKQLHSTEMEIKVQYSMAAPNRFALLKGEMVWQVNGKGLIRMKTEVNVKEEFAYLPRFGLCVVMPEGNEEVEYYGYGPSECYSDKRHHVRKGNYVSTVDGLFEDYIVPQENGSHVDTEWVVVSNLQGMGLKFASPQPFSFNASNYTPHDLEAAAHHYELKRRGETIVHLDYKMCGVGSGSVGPELAPAYRLEKEFVYELELMPLFKEDE